MFALEVPKPMSHRLPPSSLVIPRYSRACGYSRAAGGDVGEVRRAIRCRNLVSWLLLAGFGALASCAGTPESMPVAPRSSAATASAVGSALVTQLSGLSLPAREQVLHDWLLRGDYPPRVLPTVPVSLRAELGGRHRVATVFVAADYFGFGNDLDWCRMPMSPPLCQAILDRLDCVPPTRRLVDAIWRQAASRPAPATYSPREHDICASELFLAHHARIEAQLGPRSPDTLVAGVKKDLVASPLVAAHPGRVVIYGWHRPDGRAIQPLSKVHTFPHVDYSHGLRLVARRMLLDGQWTTVDAVLADPELAELLSDEGVMVPRLLPPGWPTPAPSDQRQRSTTSSSSLSVGAW